MQFDAAIRTMMSSFQSYFVIMRKIFISAKTGIFSPLSVCKLVPQKDYRRTTEPISTKIWIENGFWPRIDPINFFEDLETHAGILSHPLHDCQIRCFPTFTHISQGIMDESWFENHHTFLEPTMMSSEVLHSPITSPTHTHIPVYNSLKQIWTHLDLI